MLKKGMVKIAKQKKCKRYLFKLHSERLRRARWNLEYPLEEALNTEDIISLSDSQVLRFIDELNNDSFEEREKEATYIKKEIKRLKKSDISNYKRWCVRNIIKNPYAEENVDYIACSSTGRGSVDYRITVDFAKQLSISANSSKGLAAKKYFLACENAVKENIISLKKENEKLKLSILSSSKKFSAMYPKFNLLTNALNQRIYEHLVSLTEERHKRIYEKWQQDIQQELSHMKMKIGSPQPRMTKAYEAGYVMAETVSLSNRMKVVDALIKI